MDLFRTPCLSKPAHERMQLTTSRLRDWTEIERNEKADGISKNCFGDNTLSRCDGACQHIQILKKRAHFSQRTLLRPVGVTVVSPYLIHRAVVREARWRGQIMDAEEMARLQALYENKGVNPSVVADAIVRAVRSKKESVRVGSAAMALFQLRRGLRAAFRRLPFARNRSLDTFHVVHLSQTAHAVYAARAAQSAQAAAAAASRLERVPEQIRHDGEDQPGGLGR